MITFNTFGKGWTGYVIFVESERERHTMYFKDEGYGRIQGVRCKELTSSQRELLLVERGRFRERSSSGRKSMAKRK